MRVVFLIVLALALVLGACDEQSDLSQSEVPNPEAVEEDVAETSAYEIALGGALEDTLRGRASFGHILEPERGEESFVIALRDDEEMTGGFFLLRDPERDLTEGDHAVVPGEGADGSGFVVRYREGMRRELDGVSGNVRLEVVSDSLIEGALDVVLRGTIAQPGQPVTEGEVRASGAFRAASEPVGFIVGL